MIFLVTVLTATVVFTGIILALVGLLTLVEAKIARKGDCRIVINGAQEPLTVPAGKSLLATLAARKIFLASACGGKGTCATCKCQVLEGGGDILPTETGQLTRKEQKDHYRLSCQVKVRQDLKILVPTEILSVKEYACTVRSNRSVATFIKELVLELPEPVDFKPGQYVQIAAPPYRLSYKNFSVEEDFRQEWADYRLWDLTAENEETVTRAYSMANHPAEKGLIILNVRIATPPPNNMNLPAGIVSSYLFSLKPGDRVAVSGPFGDFFIKESKREMVYIGGGAGMAPLRSHLFHLLKTLKIRDRQISFWYGARSKREMFYDDEFEALARECPNFSYRVALSAALPGDNWKGPAGFIHQVVLDHYLKNHPEPEEIEYYLCGPGLMLKAVQKMLDSLGVPKEMIAFDDFG